MSSDAAKTIEITGELEALSTRGPFIDLIPGVISVDANTIVAIEVMDDTSRNYWLTEIAIKGFTSAEQIRAANTLVHAGHRMVLSTLTYKELRNRLRKAGATFI